MKTLTYIFLVLISLTPLQIYCDEVELTSDDIKMMRTFRFDAEETESQQDCVPQRNYDKEDRFNTFRCNE